MAPPTNHPTLKERTQFSFELATGRPGDLALWLEARGYDRVTLRNSIIEAYRLEGPRVGGQRAVITVFKSGVVVCMGHALPRTEAIDLLRSLVAQEEPAGEQLELFGGAR
jgi:hypothetical protein